MSFRLLALDMDGTLLNSAKELTPRTARALEKLQRQDWRVTLVSGRRHMGMVDAARRLQLDCPIVAFNGGLIFDPFKLQIIDCSTIELSSACGILQAWLDAGIAARLYTASFTGAEYYFFCDDHLLTAIPDLALMQSQKLAKRIFSLAEIDFEPLRLMVGGDAAETLRAAELAEPWLATEPIWSIRTMDYDGIWFLEIFPQAVNKGNGLSKLCTLLGIPLSEVIAVGDQLNDIEMLQSVGLGVAMGNAVAEVKHIAKLTIGHHDQDGLAIFVESLCRGGYF